MINLSNLQGMRHARRNSIIDQSVLRLAIKSGRPSRRRAPGSTADSRAQGIVWGFSSTAKWEVLALINWIFFQVDLLRDRVSLAAAAARAAGPGPPAAGGERSRPRSQRRRQSDRRRPPARAAPLWRRAGKILQVNPAARPGVPLPGRPRRASGGPGPSR